MVNEMLFEHEAPFLDDIEQRLLERFAIHTEPAVKQSHGIDGVHFCVNSLVGIHLRGENVWYTNVDINLCELGAGEGAGGERRGKEGERRGEGGGAVK